MGTVRAILDATLREALAAAADESRPAARRADAIRLLRMTGFDQAEAPLIEAIASRQPPEVQMAAVETLSRFDNPRVATDLLRSWPTMTPRLRAAATEVLFSRPTGVAAFLDAVEKGTVSPGGRRTGAAGTAQALSGRGRTEAGGTGVDPRNGTARGRGRGVPQGAGPEGGS